MNRLATESFPRSPFGINDIPTCKLAPLEEFSAEIEEWLSPPNRQEDY